MIQSYNEHLNIFQTSMSDLDEYLKEQKKLNTNNLVNTIDNISKNFESLNKDDKYDLKTVLSELRTVNNLNDENYLVLLSKYSKVVDELKYLNYYENKLDKFKTPKPEIINILGNLYFNILSSNDIEYEMEYNSNNNFNKNIKQKNKISTEQTSSTNSLDSIFDSMFSTNEDNKIIYDTKLERTFNVSNKIENDNDRLVFDLDSL